MPYKDPHQKHLHNLLYYKQHKSSILKKRHNKQYKQFKQDYDHSRYIKNKDKILKSTRIYYNIHKNEINRKKRYLYHLKVSL